MARNRKSTCGGQRFLAIVWWVLLLGCADSPKSVETYHGKPATEWGDILAHAQDSKTKVDSLMRILSSRGGLSRDDRTVVANQVLSALDDQPDVSEMAEEVLTKLCKDDAAGTVVAALIAVFNDDSTSFRLRSQVAQVFGRMGDDTPALAFTALTKSIMFDTEERVDLVTVAQSIGSIRSNPNNAVYALRWRLAILLPKLRSPPDSSKPISEVGDFSNLPAELRAATRPSISEVTAAIIRSLGDHGKASHSAAYLLMDAFRADDALVAACARDSLGKINESAICPLMIVMLDNGAPIDVRVDSVELIGDVIGRRGTNMLSLPERAMVISRLHHSAVSLPISVRRRLATTFGALWWPPEPSIIALITLLSDTDSGVRSDAAMGLQSIAKEIQAQGEGAKDELLVVKGALPALIDRLHDENESVREAVQDAIETIQGAAQ